MANRDDQSAVFRQRDKVRRQNLPQRRVMPAQQRFNADHFVTGQVNLRLVMEPKLGVFQGVAQIDLQAQPSFGIATHRFGEESVSIFAAALGVVHGGIGVSEQGIKILAVIGK
ncbi:MAG: hypothetical protein ACD_10C00845G0001 [uncultured bacterium]|nr:MAG: hypothetical protein ACD_10C00845G0001 [uncultured bacterium]